MHYHDPHHKNSTLTTQVVCAVLFMAFSFCWLYWLQADVLAVAQHVFSGGQTHYDRTVGAILITVVLILLQLAVNIFTRLRRRTHALTYFPSMLLLAFISDVSSGIDQYFSLGVWLWGAPVLLVVWGFVVWLAKQILPFDTDSKEPMGVFSRRMWLNTLQLAFMMLGVAAVGNTNAVFHYRAHMETALLRGDTADALRVGARSLETDEHLTMLRIYALSKENQLGERLFTYALQGNSADILPQFVGSRTQLLLFPVDSIYRHLGARPSGPMRASRYLRLLEHDSLAMPAVADYRLCGLLLDGNIDGFVRLLPHYYNVNESALPQLPRHYREALTLYTHLRSHPSLVYHDAVADEDWNNLKQLEATYTNLRERQLQVFDRYHESYWYYYLYCLGD